MINLTLVQVIEIMSVIGCQNDPIFLNKSRYKWLGWESNEITVLDLPGAYRSLQMSAKKIKIDFYTKKNIRKSGSLLDMLEERLMQ